MAFSKLIFFAAMCIAVVNGDGPNVAASSEDYTTTSVDSLGSMDYRIFLNEKDTKISPWHDVPLFGGDGTLNYLCEIPKETTPKMEMATVEEFNPILQDTKNDKLRFYPYNINWNYGMLPQTWEDPEEKDANLKDAGGDNDPVDVVEIGDTACKSGDIYNVKPLCAYAMIDDGEVDWKIVVIRADNPKAAEVNDVEDIERVFPGELEEIRTWFTNYKIPDGGEASEFGYDGKCLNKETAMKVIEETHGFYDELVSGVRANNDDFYLGNKSGSNVDPSSGPVPAPSSSPSPSPPSGARSNTGMLFLIYLIASAALVYNL